MRWSFSTNAFTDRSLFAAAAEIAAAGYEGIEILADRPHLFPPDVRERDLLHLSERLSDFGLAPASLNANTAAGYYGRDFWEPLFEPSLANPETTPRRWRVDTVRRALVVAARLGFPHVSVTPGRAVPGTDPRRSLALLAASLRELADEAAETGVRIGIEYEPGLLVENASELAALLQEVDSPWVGVNLDLGHSRVAGEDPAQVLRELGRSVFHIHLEDIRGRKHWHLVPGEGEMDFPRLLGALDDIGYDGFVTVELYTCRDRPAEAAVAALRHLERVDRERRSPCASSSPISIPSPGRSTITATWPSPESSPASSLPSGREATAGPSRASRTTGSR